MSNKSLQKLVSQLKAHRFNTDAELHFAVMKGPVDMIGGLAVEAKGGRLESGHTWFQQAVEEVDLHIEHASRDPNHKLVKLVYAPYASLSQHQAVRYGLATSFSPEKPKRAPYEFHGPLLPRPTFANTVGRCDVLTDVELAEIRFLTLRYVEELAKKNYILSDAFRNQLTLAGVIRPGKNGWHPVFESSGWRQKRLNAR